MIVKFSKDYQSVDHRNIDRKSIEDFCAPYLVALEVFSNKQVFDFDGLKGRLLSSSYAPDENYPTHNAMIEALKNIFASFNKNNTVEFDYVTKLYVGSL